MQAQPSDYIKKSTQVEARWYRESIIINYGAQVIEGKPGNSGTANISKYIPTDIYPGLIQNMIRRYKLITGGWKIT